MQELVKYPDERMFPNGLGEHGGEMAQQN